MSSVPQYDVIALGEATFTRPWMAEGTVSFRDGESLRWVARKRRDGQVRTRLTLKNYEVGICCPPRSLNLARALRREGVFNKLEKPV